MYRYLIILIVAICCLFDIAFFLQNSSSLMSSKKHVSSQTDYSKTPIVFVHGYKSYATCWNSMIEYLKRSGYPEEYLLSIQLNPNTGSNIEAAEIQIAPAVEEHIERVNKITKKQRPDLFSKQKVDLLSKSMGALSCRWYASRIRPDRIRIWMSFVGAHHGTNALCKWKDPAAIESCPAYAHNLEESQIQYILNGDPYLADVDETPFGIGMDSPGVDSISPDKKRSIYYVSIRIDPDEWIKPEESAILDGAGGFKINYTDSSKFQETSSGNILLTERVSHDSMINKNYVFKIVINILNSADKS